MSAATLIVEKREHTGKNAARRTRASGKIPAVVYGGGLEPVAIQVDRKSLQREMKSGRRDNAVFLLKLGETGKSRHVMIREVSTHSILHQITHLDFLRIDMTDKVRVQVPIELEGDSIGVKNEDGVLDFVNREISVECLPGNIPAVISFDVTELHVGQHAEIRDLVLPEDVEVVDEPEKVIVSIALSRVVEEEVEEEEEIGLLLEQEADEPELIGRGKEAKVEEESE